MAAKEPANRQPKKINFLKCLYDTGRMVHLINLARGLNKITLSATVLNKGVYIYKLFSDGNVLDKGKMVVY